MAIPRSTSATPLTDAKAKNFWPLCDAHQNDLHAINERLAKAIVTYANGYNSSTPTDEQARKLIADVFAIEKSEVKFGRTYAGKLAKVLSGKKVARNLQIGRKICALVDYELADRIPRTVT